MKASLHHVIILLVPALTTCLTTGYAGLSAGDLLQPVDFQAVPAAGQVRASATIEAEHTISPALRASWGMRDDDPVAAGLCRRFAATIAGDLVTTGLFNRVVPAAPGVYPDYRIKVQTELGWTKPSGFQLGLILRVLDGTTGIENLTVTRTLPLGKAEAMRGELARSLPSLLAGVKAEVLAGLTKSSAAQQAEAAGVARELAAASLADLIAPADGTAALTQARNQALVAARIRQLPGLLRDSRTEDLTTLVVKIEQTILGLNHTAETARDRAQQILAGGAIAAVEEQRELAIGCRERIELLKPISAAIKEELANRNR